MTMRRRALTSLTGVAVVLASYAPGTAAGDGSESPRSSPHQWSAVRTLHSSQGAVHGPRIVASGDGRQMTAAWSEERGDVRIVQAMTSADAGVSWSPPSVLSTPAVEVYGDDGPSLAASADGVRQVAVWAGEDGDDRALGGAVSADSGSTWQPIRPIEGRLLQVSPVPSLDLSANGRVAAVAATVWRWVGYDGEEDADIFASAVEVVVSTDGGATWRPAFTWQADVGWLGPAEAVVVVSDDGRVITAAWVEETPSDGSMQSRVLTTTSRDSGVTWSVPVPLSTAGGFATEPRLAASGNGRDVAVAWLRDNGSRTLLQVSLSSDHGTTWTSPRLLSPIDWWASSPRLEMSADGRALVAIWDRSYGGDYGTVQASTSTDRGLTWTDPRDLTDTGRRFHPRIAMSRDGGTLISLWSRDGGDSRRAVESRSSRDAGMTWLAPALVAGRGSEDPDSQHLAVSADGRLAIAVWAVSRPYGLQMSISGSAGVAPSRPKGLAAATRGRFTYISWDLPSAAERVTHYQWRVGATPQAMGPWQKFGDARTTRLRLTNYGKGNRWLVDIRAWSGTRSGPPARVAFVS